MSKPDDGGPVYPCKEYKVVVEGHIMPAVHEFQGITRRNECADKIAAGIWANPEHTEFLMQNLEGKTAKVCQKVAEMAYMQSDAMIAEGKK